MSNSEVGWVKLRLTARQPLPSWTLVECKDNVMDHFVHNTVLAFDFSLFSKLGLEPVGYHILFLH